MTTTETKATVPPTTAITTTLAVVVGSGNGLSSRTWTTHADNPTAAAKPAHPAMTKTVPNPRQRRDGGRR